MGRTVWLMVLVLGCGGGGSPEPVVDAGPGAAPAAADSVPVPSDPAAPAAAEAGAAEWTRGPMEAAGGGGVATLVAVRVAGHAGYDRIVFDFGADPVPGYRIRVADGPATRCGSGEAVRIGSPAVLEVAFEPARAHTEAGAPTVVERSLRPGLPMVRSLELTCDFEAHVNWAAGVDAEPLLRVGVLRDPGRLVLDVARPEAGR